MPAPACARWNDWFCFVFKGFFIYFGERKSRHARGRGRERNSSRLRAECIEEGRKCRDVGLGTLFCEGPGSGYLGLGQALETAPLMSAEAGARGGCSITAFFVHTETQTPPKSQDSLTIFPPNIWKPLLARGRHKTGCRPAWRLPPKGSPSHEAPSSDEALRKYKHLYLDWPCLIRAVLQVRPGQTQEIT